MGNILQEIMALIVNIVGLINNINNFGLIPICSLKKYNNGVYKY